MFNTATLFILWFAMVSTAPANSPTPTCHQLAAKGDAAGLARILSDHPELAARRDAVSGRSPLDEAAENGHVAAARVLIQTGAPLNDIGPTGATAIYYAAANSRAEMVKFLRILGAHEDVFTACILGDIEALDKFLVGHPELLTKQLGGRTPLHLAARFGQVEVITRLLDAGAPIDPADALSAGQTPLHQAAANAQLGVLKVLIRRGANVNAKTELGATPLHYAAAAGSVDVIRTLASAGAKRLTDAAGVEPVEWGDSHVSVVRYFLENGGLNEQQMERILFTACSKGTTDVAVYLLAKGANANALSPDRSRPLHMAAASGNLVIVKELLKHGADATVEDADGHTPEWYARVHEHEDVRDVLSKWRRPSLPGQK